MGNAHITAATMLPVVRAVAVNAFSDYSATITRDLVMGIWASVYGLFSK